MKLKYLLTPLLFLLTTSTLSMHAANEDKVPVPYSVVKGVATAWATGRYKMVVASWTRGVPVPPELSSLVVCFVMNPQAIHSLSVNPTPTISLSPEALIKTMSTALTLVDLVVLRWGFSQGVDINRWHSYCIHAREYISEAPLVLCIKAGAIMRISHSSNDEMFMELIRNGADLRELVDRPHTRSECISGENLMESASILFSSKIFKMVVAVFKEYDPDFQKKGADALVQAIFNNNLESVRVLVDARISPNATSYRIQTRRIRIPRFLPIDYNISYNGTLLEFSQHLDTTDRSNNGITNILCAALAYQCWLAYFPTCKALT